MDDPDPEDLGPSELHSRFQRKLWLKRRVMALKRLKSMMKRERRLAESLLRTESVMKTFQRMISIGRRILWTSLLRMDGR